ncbi:hypothetical protein ACS0PU_010442 [Formica fusca]
MDSIPLIFEFNIEDYILVINATNNNPIKTNKEHIFLFDKIRKYLYLCVPDVAEIRMAYNLNSNLNTSVSAIPIVQTVHPVYHVILCDENRFPVKFGAKHLLVVDKNSGKVFRVVDSIDVRKAYNLQQSQSNTKNQVLLLWTPINCSNVYRL